MSSASEHYSNLLAPIYTWMVGGADAALALGESDLADVPRRGGLAVDLGAGFGMHAVPLARAGWRVLAIDSSAALLGELSALATDLPVVTRCGDLMRFAEHLAPGERADLVLCMGDTLTHLESKESVAELSRLVASRLSPGGRFVATFRDYSRLPVGESRFIPVRADENRILTCFVEEFEDHVQVHDMLHERAAEKWKMKVSSYRKLRLAPEEVRGLFQTAGLRCEVGPGARGMVRLTADA
jgi:SAM-dependent methyltransferase